MQLNSVFFVILIDESSGGPDRPEVRRDDQPGLAYAAGGVKVRRLEVIIILSRYHALML